MRRLVMLLLVLAGACGSQEDGCTPPPVPEDYKSCKEACGTIGVKKVSYTSCTCNTVR